MSYEPRGKMVDLMAAMRASPERVFSMKDVCELLHCKPFRSTVDQYIYAAIADGALFKREVGGAMYYAGSAISDAMLAKHAIVVPNRGPGRFIPAGERSPEEVQSARADVRAPGPSGFVPKQMVAPRPGSELPRATAAPVSPTEPATAQPIEPIRTKPSQPAPQAADASIQSGAGAENDLGKRSTSTATASGHELPDSTGSAQVEARCEVANRGDARVESAGSAQDEEEDERVEFNAALWLDGDLVIYGAAETEDGGILITKEQLSKLKRLIAWSALP